MDMLKEVVLCVFAKGVIKSMYFTQFNDFFFSSLFVQIFDLGDINIYHLSFHWNAFYFREVVKCYS